MPKVLVAFYNKFSPKNISVLQFWNFSCQPFRRGFSWRTPRGLFDKRDSFRCFQQIFSPNLNVKWLKTFANTELPEKFVVSTPIFYVNDVPHLGHLYTAVIADTVSRWYRIRDVKVHFTTGTDEHGLKIQRSAKAKGLDTQHYCDSISAKYKDLFSLSSVNYDRFIRTTDNKHIEAVQKFWNVLEEGGYIYKGLYEGNYCVADEMFLSENQVTTLIVDGKEKSVSDFSGHPVELISEENYMFRLSSFSDQISKWLDQKVIKPVIFENIVRKWLEDGLEDLSVSREAKRLTWGVPVPSDPTQTVYVWLDALVSYLTVCDYPSPEFHWPADVHLIGKDILKFHAIYWPAFLLAAGLKLPKSIVCHSHWTVNNQKMSKSLGNVVNPFDKIEEFTADGFRYFLLREGVPHNDGNYSDKKVKDYLNSELSNTLGNLLNRCTTHALNPDNVYPHFSAEVFRTVCSNEDIHMIERLKKLPDLVDYSYRDFNVYRGLELICYQLNQTNAFFQRHQPWLLRKETCLKPQLDTVLHITMETLRITGILLQPVIPNLAERLLNKLSVPHNERGWKDLVALKELDEHYNKTKSSKKTTPLSNERAVFFPKIKDEKH